LLQSVCAFRFLVPENSWIETDWPSSSSSSLVLAQAWRQEKVLQLRQVHWLATRSTPAPVMALASALGRPASWIGRVEDWRIQNGHGYQLSVSTTCEAISCCCFRHGPLRSVVTRSKVCCPFCHRAGPDSALLLRPDRGRCYSAWHAHTRIHTHTHTHTHTHNAIRATRKIKTDGGAKGRGQPRENVCYENEVEAAMPREMFSTYRRVSGSWCG